MRIAAALLVTILVTACSAPAPQVTCERPSREVQQHIANALTTSGASSIRGARAILMDEDSPGGAWYVAADIEAPGLEGPDNIGIWVVPNIVTPSLLYSANGHAYEFSGMGYFGDVNHFSTSYADRVRLAGKCTETALRK